jgi:hypothetical protein
MKRYGKEITDASGSARLIGIIAKQVTNRVSTIKLPDGQCTQIGREILKELFRDHFPQSKLTGDSNNGQGSRTWIYADGTGETGIWPGM